MIALMIAAAEQLIDTYGYDAAVRILVAASGTSANLVRAFLSAVGL